MSSGVKNEHVPLQSLDWFRVLENLNSGSEFLLTLKVKSEFGGKNLKKKI